MDVGEGGVGVGVGVGDGEGVEPCDSEMCMVRMR